MIFGRQGARGGFGSLGLLGGASSPYDPATNALVAAMTTPPTAARKILINNLIVSLKASGAWAVLDFLYVLAAADGQSARLNWKNPALFTASSINAPAFVADRGYTGDGSSSLLDTGFAPSTAGGNFAQNSAHIGFWDRLDVATTPAAPIGNINATLQNKAAVLTSYLHRVNGASTLTDAGLSSAVLNHYVGNRNNSANEDVWAAGAKIISASVNASSALSALSITLLARQIGVGSYQFNNKQISAAHLGGALSNAQITGMYSALSTYMTAVGA